MLLGQNAHTCPVPPIAADLRFGAVRVKGRRSRRDAVGALMGSAWARLALHRLGDHFGAQRFGSLR